MSELQQLIREQQAERRLGAYQPREPFVAFSLDTEASSQSTAKDMVDQEGVLHWQRVRAERYADTCPIHGSTQMVLHGDGRYRCRPCMRERSEANRRAQGMKPRGVGPQCGHHPSNFRVSTGVKRTYNYCRVCRSTEARARYHKDPEKHRARLRRAYWQDPDKARARRRAQKGLSPSGGDPVSPPTG